MDTALPQIFPFILDRNLAKANCTRNRVCTSCDTVVLGLGLPNSQSIKLVSAGVELCSRKIGANYAANYDVFLLLIYLLLLSIIINFIINIVINIFIINIYIIYL